MLSRLRTLNEDNTSLGNDLPLPAIDAKDEESSSYMYVIKTNER